MNDVEPVFLHCGTIWKEDIYLSFGIYTMFMVHDLMQQLALCRIVIKSRHFLDGT